MKLLLCHNHYQQPGGEDQVFADERWLLESAGHEVVTYVVHNDALRGMSRWKAACKTLWNPDSYREVRDLIRRERPELVHCHNTFPLISPSVYAAARAERVPVVQTLHNYRLLCPNGLLLRDGKPCEDCLGRWLAWPGVLHACYRQDRLASGVVAAMLGLHRGLRTFSRGVERYIAISDFARRKFIQGGLPAEKLVTKPNFVRTDPGIGAGRGGYAVFVGRLDPGKGVLTLLAAWRRLNGRFPLKILGDGSVAAAVRAAAELDPRIEYLGHCPMAEVLSLVGEAVCLIVPSLWYEACLPKTILEAYAKGTPVVASRVGAMQAMIDDGREGLLFAPGNAEDLASKVEGFFTADTAAMRQAARQQYERHYTARDNYRALMDIYGQVLPGRPAVVVESEADAMAPAPSATNPQNMKPLVQEEVP